jgi:transcriptional regulator with XRE-family HTH domain
MATVSTAQRWFEDRAGNDEAWTRAELTRFLKRSRDRLQPNDVGLPSRGVRRVVGLRREEVAELVGVSLTWYTMFELGKADAVSARFLSATANALRLNEVEQKYLFALCNATTPLPMRSGERPGLIDLVAEHDDAALALLNGGLQFVSGNNLCRKLYLLDGVMVDTPAADLPVRIFEDPRSYAFFENWDDVALLACASLRMQLAHRDPRAIRTVGALRENPRFRAYWDQGTIADLRHVDQTIVIRHPVVGRCGIRLRGVGVLDRDHILVVAMPGDEQTRESFRRLAHRSSRRA